MKSIVIIFSFLFSFNAVSAQTDCPIGMVNDPAPGSCGSYIDKDKNALCDLSELEVITSKDNVKVAVKLSEEEFKQKTVSGIAEIYGISAVEYAKELGTYLKKTVSTKDSMAVLHDENALCSSVAAGIAANIKSGKALAEIDKRELISGSELKTKTVKEAANIFGISPSVLAEELGRYYKVNINQDDSIQLLHDNYGLEPSVIKDIAAKTPSASGEGAAGIASIASVQEKSSKPKYDFFIILFVLISAYLFTYVLAMQKKISFLTQQRFWNVLLAIFFLLSGLSGLFLVLRINYGLAIAWPFNLLWLHVETGIAMAIISIFHMVWHWRYYGCIIRRKKKDECELENRK